jgi:hypothetical protein
VRLLGERAVGATEDVEHDRRLDAEDRLGRAHHGGAFAEVLAVLRASVVQHRSRHEREVRVGDG